CEGSPCRSSGFAPQPFHRYHRQRPCAPPPSHLRVSIPRPCEWVYRHYQRSVTSCLQLLARSSRLNFTTVSTFASAQGDAFDCPALRMLGLSQRSAKTQSEDN